ncbi:hypothetical protein CPB84DRAFT_1779241 [Gymnopilus junonius]|uniref:Uncharacterized protein n=1 Tax=Gymnopilus junonius TaxID=109634 RepID=A0A9P5NQA1_GYMJU|nr:hypothetical protein CPB84DRAFT_1779241 [Gymnopilus junonius]
MPSVAAFFRVTSQILCSLFRVRRSALLVFSSVVYTDVCLLTFFAPDLSASSLSDGDVETFNPLKMWFCMARLWTMFTSFLLLLFILLHCLQFGFFIASTSSTSGILTDFLSALV